jgi:hypothetical protein
MKNLLTVFVCLCVYPTGIFAQWIDDFSESRLSPLWQGDTGKFMVDAGWLRLNDELAGTSYLARTSDIAWDASWSFTFRMDFNPSSANYAKVYLMSDQADLTAPLNGYFLRLGGTDDDICLFRQNGNTVENLISGRKKVLDAASNLVQVVVTRDAQAYWTLKTKLAGEPENVLEGGVLDNRVKQSTHFGVVCIYSVTRSKAFHFDDFQVAGQAYIDAEAPTVISIGNERNQLQVIFSEAVTTASVWTDHFTIAENIYPSQIIPNEAQTDFTLTLPEGLQCGVRHRLSVSGLTDGAHNMMRDTSLYFTIPCSVLPHDIVINEVMANPTPSVFLPEYEYIELYNRSGKNLELNGWTITYGTTTKSFPAYFFPAGSYLLLVHANAAPDMAAYGATLPILGAQSAISNAGQYLVLQDAEGTVISWIDFNTDWYIDDFKDNGGWSLEQIDPEQWCSGAFNWKASIDRKGGTPGKGNSVFAANEDVQKPKFQQIAIPNEHTLILYASKPLGNAVPDFSMAPDMRITDVQVGGRHFDQLQLTLQDALQEGQWYDLSVTGDMIDCAGYAILAGSFHFSPPQNLENLDVIINEVLFRPVSGGYTFIELYNRSQKAVRISDLQLSMRNANGNLSTPASLTDEPYILLPGQYLVVSRNPAAITQQYDVNNPDCMLQMMNMPTLTREAGQLVLLDKSLLIVDEIHYNNDAHAKFLTETSGVSLERIHPDRNSLDPASWHTAAQSVGFATPGRKNSQYVDAVSEQNGVTLLPEVFSPDNDGIDDVLNICYKFDVPSLMGEVIIFDASGRKIRQLLPRQILETEGIITWDGADESAHKALTGMYIIYFHAYNSLGFNKVIKTLCVLAGKRK